MKELRAALSGLTTRGRCLLSAGTALAVCAVLLGQRDLLRAAVFLLALPVAAVAVVSRTRYRLACTRRLDPVRVEVGRAADVHLRLSNVSRLPSGVLRMEDTLPYVLGGRPRFVLDRVEPQGVREVAYPVTSPSRGRFRIGPLSVRMSDPFGLCELSRAFASSDELVVTPAVEPLPPVPLGGDWAGGGETASRATAASGSDDVSTREYRHGDDLRKVHWRSTARVGELMVRREEQPYQSRATLLLDTRESAHRGEGPDSSFEYAVSAVASIGVSLLRAGYAVKLVTDADTELVPPGLGLSEGLLLDLLAGVTPGRGSDLAPALERLRRGVDGTLVAVLGDCSPSTAERLGRLRSGSTACTAVLLDTRSWVGTAHGSGRSEAGTEPLLRAGWRVLTATHGAPLASVWQSAARAAGSRPAAAGPLHPLDHLGGTGVTVRDRLSAVSALAVLLATSALWEVFDSPGWLLRTVGAIVVVAAASALARRAGAPGPVVPLVTAVALAAYLVVVFASATLHAGVVPGPATVRAFRALLEAGNTDLSQYGPPAPPTTALVLLAAGGVGLVAVVVDAIASAAGRSAAAGLPLLALFAVPSAVLPGGLGWLPFVLGATGWLALLLVEGREQQQRWGTPLRATAVTDPAGLGRVGRRIGGAALGVAVLVPLLVPGLDARLLDGGSGDGGGGGGTRSVTTYNPITRLRGELSLPDPVDVLRYTTDDPQPDYLRMTTLGVYDGAGWRQEVLRGNLRDNGVDDPVPTPVGRSVNVRTRSVTDKVSVLSLDAFWLPAPATPAAVTVAGPWMWDAGSESVFSTRSNTSKVTSYTVRASRVLPDPTALASGDAPVPTQIQPYTAPVQATEQVRALTSRIVRGQTTDYGRAMAIQAYFRNPANKFLYSDDTETGSSPDALQDFLTNKQGFCEQYASAMGAMLRLAGVPSRVAVGFTPGERQPDGSYLVTTDQAHAWPEAWFEGAGWVRFEPTPSRGGITPPVYAAPAPTGSQAPAATATPTTPPADPGLGTAETPAERSERLAAEREGRTVPVAGSSRDTSSGLPVRAVAVGALVLLLLASPALLHLLRRRLRWRSPSPDLAWEQLRDDAGDTGHDWRGSESPRQAGARLTAETGLSGAAAAAVERLTSAVERARYAPPAAQTAGPGDPGSDRQLAADSASVRAALRAGTSRGRRLRSVLLPPSTLAWATSRAGTRTADLLDSGDRLLGSLGTRLRRRSA